MMRTFKLSSSIVFDNDCLSSFLWVQRPDLLIQIFNDQILVPDPVINELLNLKNTKYNWILDILDKYITTGLFKTFQIPVVGDIATEYYKLINEGKPMGSGEASVLSYVRYNGGTAASNNLNDVQKYCRNFGIELICTDDILCIAKAKGFITISEGDNLWEEMKNRKRKLPPYDFNEALRRFDQDLQK